MKKGAFPSFKHHLSLSQKTVKSDTGITCRAQADQRDWGGGWCWEGQVSLQTTPSSLLAHLGERASEHMNRATSPVYPSHRYVSVFRLFEIVDGIKQPTATYKNSPTSTMSANKGSFDWDGDQTVNQEPGHCVTTGLICQDAIVCKVLGFCGGLRIMKYNIENVKYKNDTLRGKKDYGTFISTLLCQDFVQTYSRHIVNNQTIVSLLSGLSLDTSGMLCVTVMLTSLNLNTLTNIIYE